MLEWLFVADISALGWIHSIVGLAAISVGLYSLVRHQAKNMNQSHSDYLLIRDKDNYIRYDMSNEK